MKSAPTLSLRVLAENTQLELEDNLMKGLFREVWVGLRESMKDVGELN